jgi:hypothetical protein
VPSGEGATELATGAVFFKMLLGAAGGADGGVSISSISFLPFSLSSYVARFGWPMGYNDAGTMTVRGWMLPFERMLGMPRDRESGMEERASILCRASSGAVYVSMDNQGQKENPTDQE